MTKSRSSATTGVAVTAAAGPRDAEILTAEALAFLAALHRRFDPERKEVLQRRATRQVEYDQGQMPDFQPETAEVRWGDWKVAALPDEVLDRRVEMPGTPDAATVTAGLTSGAKVFIADFEDGLSPTWRNVVDGQLALLDRWAGRLKLGKKKPAVLMIRPRGWHLPEAHVTVDGEAVNGGLFDAGLYLFHNARACLDAGSHPYLCVAKLEGRYGARLWNRIAAFVEDELELPRGAIKVTVLIETITAAFQMDEILYELRDRAIGLTCGRWDYIFSLIKAFREYRNHLLPDRTRLGMDAAFLLAYSELLIRTCHRRGVLAIGGQSDLFPEGADAAALADVKADKEREVRAGHDGTWVAHAGLIPIATEVFDRLMPGPNQLDRALDDRVIDQDCLLEAHEGSRTEAGFAENIRIAVRYLEAWLRGEGSVLLYGRLEDAATAEISRAQVWQQLRFRATLAEGIKVTPQLFEKCLAEELAKVEKEIGARAYAAGRFPEAVALFRELSLSAELAPFLTLAAYPKIV